MIYMSISNLLTQNSFNLNGNQILFSNGTQTSLSYFEETTHITTFTGPFTSSSITIFVKRIGNNVTLSFRSIQGTVTVAAILSSTVPLPIRFRPLFNQTYAIRGISAGTIQMITVSILDTGIITFSTIGNTAFTAGTCGTASTGFSYVLDAL